MTWRDLIINLLENYSSQLNTDVTVRLFSSDEYISVSDLACADGAEQNVLDDGHPYLIIED